MYPRADRRQQDGVSMIELTVALAVALLLAMGVLRVTGSLGAVACQGELAASRTEQAAGLLRRLQDAASAMETDKTPTLSASSLSFPTRVLRGGKPIALTATLRNQCVDARFAGVNPKTIAASPAWKACALAPRCPVGKLPRILLEGMTLKVVSLPAASASPRVAAQSLLGAYFCGTVKAAGQVQLTIVDVRSGASAELPLVAEQRTLLLGANPRVSARVQLFLPGAEQKQ